MMSPRSNIQKSTCWGTPCTIYCISLTFCTKYRTRFLVDFSVRAFITTPASFVKSNGYFFSSLSGNWHCASHFVQKGEVRHRQIKGINCQKKHRLILCTEFVKSDSFPSLLTHLDTSLSVQGTAAGHQLQLWILQLCCWKLRDSCQAPRKGLVYYGKLYPSDLQTIALAICGRAALLGRLGMLYFLQPVLCIPATGTARFPQIPSSLWRVAQRQGEMDHRPLQPGDPWDDKHVQLSSSEPAVMPATPGQTSRQLNPSPLVFANVVFVCVQARGRKGELTRECISQD